MKKIAAGILVLCVVTKSFATNIQPDATPHNLEPSSTLNCIDPEKWSNKYTPVDLYQASAKCVAQDKYKEGVSLYLLAGIYSRFDMLRVADKTAHQAGLILLMGTYEAMGEDKRNTFKDFLRDELETPNKLATLCKKVAHVGSPDYYPDYMIQHGMNAFFEKSADNGMVANFDAQIAWKKLLGVYLHCPGYKNTDNTEL